MLASVSLNLAPFLFVPCLIAVNFTSGCLAGLVATLTSQPFDTLRTRFIGQGEPKVSVHGSVHAINAMILKHF